ncbi:histidine kinase dimerization/phosphoacceptor domain-containing protein [Actinospica sp.]|uniref:histidine kinase dimerization/phosphoacceptor domain-containing protein n=1 Tax=Actinospica sp. TaxID=1872142 RepID=UPI002BF4949E|nr:histidine kinase dimerization/phosphoacceptor domain-containing protein [Actinospica sp.]HWG24237.1 histidine kinase dimerization/phosphoacceptor domain-containing protein [Actinospica sp.]
MSVISVQAELAHYVFESDPAQARESLGLIAAASRDAVGEMRNLLTVLRPDTPTRDEAELEYTPALSLDRCLSWSSGHGPPACRWPPRSPASDVR